MISFNNIGHMGRLGNQMFQYAALKGISYNNNYEYPLPQSKIQLNKCFKIPKCLNNQNKNILTEKIFTFDENFFNFCPDNVDISGFFQTEKYFKHIESEIRNDFTFYNETYDIASSYMDGMFLNTEVISMHVRRTDYTTDDGFECLSLDYYETALKKFPELPVLILSDDPNWCKNYFKSERFFISLSADECIDLCLMSLCDYHIIANSTFSWWGSWLAKSKKTIAPKYWFDGQCKTHNTKDLYLSDWILV